MDVAVALVVIVPCAEVFNCTVKIDCPPLAGRLGSVQFSVPGPDAPMLIPEHETPVPENPW